MSNGLPLDAVRDVVPFTAEVYLRLFERLNAAQWPLPFLTPLLGLGLLGFAARGRARLALIGLALAWAWVGASFYARLYTELTFVGRYLCGAFLLQALLLLVAGLIAPLQHATGRSGPARLGALIAAAALVGYILLPPLTGRGWSGAQCFGLAPAPTVLVTLGLLLRTVRPRWLMPLAPIPLLWSLLHGLVEGALGFASAPMAPLASLLVLGGGMWHGVERRAAAPETREA